MLEKYIKNKRTRFIVKRVVRSIPVVFIASIVIFSILHLSSGNPAKIMLGVKATPEAIEQLEHEMGLDQPLPVQYYKWMKGIVTLDWGRSIRYDKPVLDLIKQRLPLTLKLMGLALAFSTAMGIGMGILGALRRNTWVDYLTTIQALFWRSMPSFWLGIMFLYLFAVELGWFSIAGYTGLWSLVLPMLVLGLRLQAIIARLTRSSMINVLNKDYIKTAKAKGLTGNFIIVKHALRNALIPVVTILALRIPWLFSGAMITEIVFTISGMGRLIYSGVLARDYPLVQGCILLMSITVIIANMAADIGYTYIDPRIDIEQAGRRR